jgi:hypothetical protein
VDVTCTAILVAGVGVVLTLALALRPLQRRFDPFDPIVIFSLAWGVMFVVRPAAILIRGDTDFYGVDIGSTLDRAVLLGLLGAVGFIVGYHLRVGRRLARAAPGPPGTYASSTAVAAAFVVSALGMLALGLLLLPHGGLHALDTFVSGRSFAFDKILAQSTSYLWWSSLLVVPAGLAGLAIALVDPKPLTIVSASVLLALALFRTIPIGNRIFLLTFVGGVIVFVYLRVDRRPGLVALVVGLGLALVVSYAIVNFRYPDTRRSLSGTLHGVVSTPSRVFAPLTKGPDAEMAPALAGALRVIPGTLHYRYGDATFGDLVRRPIPRQWWPDKPQPPGRQVVALVWPRALAEGSFDPAFTPLLYFFWDFGLVGVFVGMALYGVSMRLLFEYLLLHRRNVVAQLLFASGLWYLVVALRHDPAGVFVQAVVLFVPLIAIFAIPRRAFARGEARGRPRDSDPF